MTELVRLIPAAHILTMEGWVQHGYMEAKTLEAVKQRFVQILGEMEDDERIGPLVRNRFREEMERKIYEDRI